MKNEQDKKIDDLFKKGLENPEQPSGYRVEDWDALEQMLDQHKKRRVIGYLWPILSSVAAIMLAFIAWWLFRANGNHKNNQHEPQFVKTVVPKTSKRVIDSVVSRENKSAEIVKNSLQQAIYTAKTVQGKNINNVNGKNATLTNKTAIVATSLPNKNRDSVFDKAFAKNHPLIGNAPVNSKRTVEEPLADSNYIEARVSKNTIASVANEANQPMTPSGKLNTAITKLSAQTSPPTNLSVKNHASFKPSFTGVIIGAQDVNGAGSFKQSKLGSKAGLLFVADVSHKITISSGAVYSSTPYAAGVNSFNLPYRYSVNPVGLSAKCQMLDIPINVGYRVYDRGKNTISLGTGLSSYIMLQQDYNFVYSSSSGVAPKDYSVPNTSSYLFKIINFNATYERKISSKAGITVQPYLKLPLADIGYSQVRLQSTGVAVGLSWSLDSSQP